MALLLLLLSVAGVRAQYQAGRFQQALDEARQLLKRESTAELWDLAGTAALRLGRTEEAVDLLVRGSRRHPDSPPLLRSLGLAYQKMGHWNDTIGAFQSMARLLPEAAEPQALLGNSYLELGKPKTAAEHLERAHRLDPHDARIAFLLGLAYAYQNRNDLARPLWLQAIKLNAGLCAAYYQLGKDASERGDFSTAVDFCRQASVCDPRYPEPHYLLGRLYKRSGDHQKAEQEMLEFLRLRMK